MSDERKNQSLLGGPQFSASCVYGLEWPAPGAVGPDNPIKITQICLKLPKKLPLQFYLKSDAFRIAQNVTKYLVYFYMKICHQ